MANRFLANSQNGGRLRKGNDTIDRVGPMVVLYPTTPTLTGDAMKIKYRTRILAARPEWLFAEGMRIVQDIRLVASVGLRSRRCARWLSDTLEGSICGSVVAGQHVCQKAKHVVRPVWFWRLVAVDVTIHRGPVVRYCTRSFALRAS